MPKYAQSGATLICLGSSKIILSEGAQLSPLDPQVLSKRRGKFLLGERQSPLEAFRAVTELRRNALSTLSVSMLHLIRETGVAPQPALGTATTLAGELTKPILENIDPYDLGAFALDSDVAKNYCRRLCLPGAGKAAQSGADHGTLVERYPAHEFVIDLEEARTLGLAVEEPDDALDELFDELRPLLSPETSERRTELSYIGLVPAHQPESAGPDNPHGEEGHP